MTTQSNFRASYKRHTYSMKIMKSWKEWEMIRQSNAETASIDKLKLVKDDFKTNNIVKDRVFLQWFKIKVTKAT